VADELHECSALDLAKRLANGSTSSRAVVDDLLDRIAQLDAPGTEVALRSILAVADDARDAAARADEERSSR
jgi:Asp-tRNA(Asn)/Glu-tRNA(Gln) amidotransferase A subunit family amidase